MFEADLRRPRFVSLLGDSHCAQGKVLLESELERLGIRPSHARPYHPQTCGKVERLHQTQKRWLAKQPAAATLEELSAQLDRFRLHYNYTCTDRTARSDGAHPRRSSTPR